MRFSISSARRAVLPLWIFLLLGSFTASAAAQETGNCISHDASSRPDCAGAIAFFQKVQPAVKAGDKKLLASMVSYPLRAWQNGKKIKIHNRQQFLKSYSQLFNPAVVCAIEAAKGSDVWGNYQGFMVGNGVIWWDQVIPATVKNPQPDSGKYPFKIISINNEGVTVPACGQSK